MATISLRRLNKEWVRINRAVSSELGEADVLEGINQLDKTVALGEGEWGIVFPTNCPGWVLKITEDRTENRITRLILDNDVLHSHPGMAYVLNAWSLKSIPGYSVILREDIHPTSPNLIKSDKEIVERMSETRDLGEELNDAKFYNSFRYGGLRIDWLVELKDIGKSDARLYEITDFMVLFTNLTGYALADMHVGNLGYRKYNLTDIQTPHGTQLRNHIPGDYFVALDTGNSSYQSQKTLPLIPNPASRINWI